MYIIYISCSASRVQFSEKVLFRYGIHTSHHHRMKLAYIGKHIVDVRQPRRKFNPYVYLRSLFVCLQVCFVMIALTWTLSFGIYTLLIFPGGQYHFDGEGIMSCEPHYVNDRRIIIIGISLFYVPPSITIFYCYISIFVAARSQLYNLRRAPIPHTNNKSKKQALTGAGGDRRTSDDLELRGVGRFINQRPSSSHDDAAPRLRCDSVQQVSFYVYYNSHTYVLIQAYMVLPPPHA